jgi:hypothetical protein
MEIVESASWLVLGFIPALCTMELSWKITQKRAKTYKQNIVFGMPSNGNR